jgi:hypothetical protein
VRGPRSLIAPAALVILAELSACGGRSDRAAAGAPDAAIACASSGIADPPAMPATCPAVSSADFVWGQEVNVAAGKGTPPTAIGGALTPGWYVLVSKTVFGEDLGEATLYPGLFPDLAQEVQEIESGAAREIAHVTCSAIDTIYTTSHAPDPDPTGETCRTLVPRSVPLAEVSFDIPFKAYGGFATYTATGDSVTLVTLLPVASTSGGVAGSFTIVDRFERASTFKPVTAPDAGPVPFDASASPFAPGERDPRCPANPPAEGDTCNPDPVPLQCEYGGDAWARCTTVASCTLAALDAGGDFHFHVSQAMDCPPNPAACPADFAAALALVDAGVPPSSTDAPGLEGPPCNYDQAVCGYPSASYAGSCGWMCRLRAGVGAACPPVRPLAGTPCSSEGVTCTYDNNCAPYLSLGTSNMVCQFGHWAIDDSISFCTFSAGCPGVADE